MPEWVTYIKDVLYIVTLLWAVYQISKTARRDMRGPYMKQEDRIAVLEADVKLIKGLLDNDDKRLVELENGTKITAISLLAIMENQLDGENKEKLAEAKDGLQRYLIERKYT